MRPLVIALLATTSLAFCGCEEQGELDPAAAPTECAPDWPGPWTACPEAEWVERVAEHAGYRVTGETGSALIAQGKGQSFYIWGFAATEDEVDRAKREDWRPLGVVEGVVVYGDDDLWRWWEVDEFILWVQAGPYEDSRPPSLVQMDALVEASSMVP